MGVNSLDKVSPVPVRTFPRCTRCSQGTLVPLSDYNGPTALPFKVWICTNEDCDFNLKIRLGEIIVDEPVWDGSPP